MAGLVRAPLKGMVVVGFPGMGNIGPLSTRQLIDAFSMKYVGYIDAPTGSVARVRRGEVYHPISVFSNKEMSVVHSLVSLPEDTSLKLGREMVGKASKEGVQLIIALAGVMNAESPSYIASTKKAREIAKKTGFEMVENGFTTGISASLLLAGREMNFPVILLLAPVRRKVDVEGAEIVLKGLSSIIGKKIPLEQLSDMEDILDDTFDPTYG